MSEMYTTTITGVDDKQYTVNTSYPLTPDMAQNLVDQQAAALKREKDREADMSDGDMG